MIVTHMVFGHKQVLSCQGIQAMLENNLEITFISMEGTPWQIMFAIEEAWEKSSSTIIASGILCFGSMAWQLLRLKKLKPSSEPPPI